MTLFSVVLFHWGVVVWLLAFPCSTLRAVLWLVEQREMSLAVLRGVSARCSLCLSSGAVFCAWAEWAKAELRFDRAWTRAHAAGRRLLSALYGVGHPAVMGLLWHWKASLGRGEDKMFGQIKKQMKEETSSEQKGVHLIAPTVKRKKHSLIPVESFVLFWVFFF